MGKFAEGSEPDEPVAFIGLGTIPGANYCFYRVGPYRVPEAGEWYLSGAIVEAYQAKQRLGNPYRIVTPTYKAKRITAWARGEAVK